VQPLEILKAKNEKRKDKKRKQKREMSKHKKTILVENGITTNEKQRGKAEHMRKRSQ
jgi:hypothetical protein